MQDKKRIVIDCTEKEHRDVKIYCSTKGKKIKEFCLIAVKEKMERER